MIPAYLHKLDHGEVTVYMRCVASIANIDGKIHPRERQYFMQILGLISLPDYMKANLEKELDRPQDIRSLLKDVKNPYLKMMILQDAYTMAYIDGDFHKSESKAILDIGKLLGVKEGLLSKVKDWAIRGVEWHSQGEKLLQESIFYERVY
jgi:tellurite resistance protein